MDINRKLASELGVLPKQVDAAVIPFPLSQDIERKQRVHSVMRFCETCMNV